MAMNVWQKAWESIQRECHFMCMLFSQHLRDRSEQFRQDTSLEWNKWFPLQKMIELWASQLQYNRCNGDLYGVMFDRSTIQPADYILTAPHQWDFSRFAYDLAGLEVRPCLKEKWKRYLYLLRDFRLHNVSFASFFSWRHGTSGNFVDYLN